METGLTQLPEGASELTAQELRFVLGMLRHGRQRKAAIEAGYSVTSAHQIASETIRKPRVAAFYRKCLEAFGADARAAIARTEQRARMLDAKAVGLLDNDCATVSEEAAAAVKLALDHDKVLISAGTAAKVELSGELKGGGGGITITPELMAALTAAREGREVGHVG
ncbi:MAG: Terminase small subunit [Verrucomicrobiota bacterium]